MPVSLDATFYVKEPPEIVFEDGHFHICQRIGGYQFERVMSPHVFLRTLARARKALAKYEGGRADVVPIKRAGH